MTTSLKQFENWIANEVGVFEAAFSAEEAAVLKFLAPLGAQIVAAVEALGKATFADGLQALKDAATQAVAAGAAAAQAGGNAIATAEATFVQVGAADGLTVIHNAEAGAIKAAVAIAQGAVAAIPTPAA